LDELKLITKQSSYNYGAVEKYFDDDCYDENGIYKFYKQ
jgi:hypothetical protein